MRRLQTAACLLICVSCLQRAAPSCGQVLTQQYAAAFQAKLAEGMRNGVYVGFYRYRYSSRANYRFLVLFPDGWIMLGVPEQGLDGFNFQNYLNQPGRDRALTGHYRVYGTRLDIIWQDSPDHRESVNLDEGSGDIHGLNLYTPACGKCGEGGFAGTYRWGEATLQLLPNGSFIDRGGFIDQLLTLDLNHPRSGTGTYTIGDYSVTLNYSDGRHITKSFLRGKNAEWIAISEIVVHPPGYEPLP